jgi:hypothetical protein
MLFLKKFKIVSSNGHADFSRLVATVYHGSIGSVDINKFVATVLHNSDRQPMAVVTILPLYRHISSHIYLLLLQC